MPCRWCQKRQCNDPVSHWRWAWGCGSWVWRTRKWSACVWGRTELREWTPLRVLNKPVKIEVKVLNKPENWWYGFQLARNWRMGPLLATMKYLTCSSFGRNQLSSSNIDRLSTHTKSAQSLGPIGNLDLCSPVQRRANQISPRVNSKGGQKIEQRRLKRKVSRMRTSTCMRSWVGERFSISQKLTDGSQLAKNWWIPGSGIARRNNSWIFNGGVNVQRNPVHGTPKNSEDQRTSVMNLETCDRQPRNSSWTSDSLI